MPGGMGGTRNGSCLAGPGLICFDCVCACQLTFFRPCSRSRRSADPGRLVFSDGCSWAQPERDMGGLHGLLHHGDQFLMALSSTVKIHGPLVGRDTVGSREYYFFEIYPQSSYADHEAPEREHSQRDRHVLFPQPLSAQVPSAFIP